MVLSELTNKELKGILRENNVRNYSKLNKKNLVKKVNQLIKAQHGGGKKSGKDGNKKYTWRKLIGGAPGLNQNGKPLPKAENVAATRANGQPLPKAETVANGPQSAAATRANGQPLPEAVNRANSNNSSSAGINYSIPNSSAPNYSLINNNARIPKPITVSAPPALSEAEEQEQINEEARQINEAKRQSLQNINNKKKVDECGSMCSIQ